MSVSNTPPTIPVPIPLSTTYTMNNVVSVLPSSKATLPNPVVYQTINKVPISSVSTSIQSTTLFVPDGTQKLTNFTAPLLVSTANAAAGPLNQKSPSVTPAIVKSVSQASKVPQSQPAKTIGKHQLPIRSISAAVPHVVPRPNSMSTALLDPGGGIHKGVSIHSTMISAGSKTQHVLVAPGLRTPTPTTTIKFTQPFHHQTIAGFNTLPFQLPNQQQTSSNNSSSSSSSGVIPGKPVSTISTTRGHQPLVVRPIHPQAVRQVPAIGVGTANQEVLKRPGNALHPTTTISISLPTKASVQQDTILSTSSSRISVTSGAGGKPVFQVGIAASTPSSTFSLTNPKVPRKVVSQRSATAVSSNQITRTASLSCATTVSTSVTSFTYSAAPPRITASAIPAAKVFAQQPSVSGISAHVRTSDFHQHPPFLRQSQSSITTAQSTIPSSTTLASTSGTAAMVQPMLYMPPSGLSINFPYPAQPTLSSYNAMSSTIRPHVAISAANPTAMGPIRLSQPLLVMEPRISGNTGNVAAFTQGQTVLQNVPSTQTVGSEPSRLIPAQISTSQVSTSLQHIPNMSPKPAILRRPGRSENINKKLNFYSDPKLERGSPVKVERNTSPQENSETVYTMKPILPGKVKPIVTSNGMGPARKTSNPTKEFTPTQYIKTEVPAHRISHTGTADHKLIESAYPVPASSKNDSVSGQISQHHRFHATYHLQGAKSQDGGNSPSQGTFHPSAHAPPGSKVRQLQQRGMVTVTAAPRLNHIARPPQHPAIPTAIPPGVQIKQLNAALVPNFSADAHAAQDSKLKLSASAPAGALKRPYEKINQVSLNEDVRKMEALPRATQAIDLAVDPMTGLSPRKKPRKQTHVVAEELPGNFQMIDDEMSTDDADECEDERPLAAIKKSPPTNNKVNSQSVNSESKKQPVLPVAKPATEYTDKDGVRYVVNRERPPINLLNGHRSRPATNHFTHYSDVKVKEKKVSFQDQCFNVKYLNGWKVQHLAGQLDQLMSLDAEVLSRIEQIKNNLMQHCRTVLNGNSSPCESNGGKSPAHILPMSAGSTPTQTRNLASAFPKSFSSSAGDNSPLTPSEKRASRLREEILKTEEMAQANIQRCNVLREQLSEAKSQVVKGLENRDLATKLVEAGREMLKTPKSNTTSNVRLTKKKKS